MIYSGNDRAKEVGCKTYREMIDLLAKRNNFIWTGQVDECQDLVVNARIDYGRWIGDCPCGAAGYVEPTDPIFFCALCGNHFANRKAVMVIFPENRSEIENILNEREIIPGAGAGTQSMLNSRARYGGATRSWNPGESVDDLRDQYARARGVSNGV